MGVWKSNQNENQWGERGGRGGGLGPKDGIGMGGGGLGRVYKMKKVQARLCMKEGRKGGRKGGRKETQNALNREKKMLGRRRRSRRRVVREMAWGDLGYIFTAGSKPQITSLSLSVKKKEKENPGTTAAAAAIHYITHSSVSTTNQPTNQQSPEPGTRRHEARDIYIQKKYFVVRRGGGVGWGGGKGKG